MSSTTPPPPKIDLSSLSSPTFSASSFLNEYLSTIPATSLKPALQNLSLQSNLEIQRTHTHLQTLQRKVLTILSDAPQSLDRMSSSLSRVNEARRVLQSGVDELPPAPEATSRLMELHERLEELEVMERTMEGIGTFEDTSRMVAKNVAGRDIEEAFKGLQTLLTSIPALSHLPSHSARVTKLSKLITAALSMLKPELTTALKVGSAARINLCLTASRMSGPSGASEVRGEYCKALGREVVREWFGGREEEGMTARVKRLVEGVEQVE
ncbi:hypothetical protein TrRE_jg12625, partial [Triparma retinervis]